MNEMRKLIETIEGIEENFETRRVTNLLHEYMDEGALDPRGVADACLTYMSEADVADMAEVNGMLPDWEVADWEVEEGIEEDKKQMKGEDPCWDGYEMVGMKKKDGKEVPNCVPEGVEEYTIEDATEIFGPLGSQLNEDELDEAEYQGRKVELNKPTAGDVKKFKVYVKNDKGNVVKVNFGEKGTKIKKNNPERRKSFRARHNCDNPGPKWKARYWSCRKW